jgi:hypothetical protein
MSLLEFMELIVRVADFWISQEVSIEDKIASVLDEWLPLVHCEKQDPVEWEDLEEQESGNEGRFFRH